jgi:thiamine-monophosphate kinase
LVTTDFSLENVHFRREWHPAESVGHRCLARGLSDIAAMGGEPMAAFLSLALPADLPQEWVDGFVRGLLKLASRFKVPLAGGDIAQSQTGVLADIMVVGSVPQGKAVLRSGARAGDQLYVTGTLGGSAATLGLLQHGRKIRAKDYPQHFAPTPRIEVGRVLREKKLATAMIDISDGLSVDLRHICEESGMGARIDAGRLPLAELGKPHRFVDESFALHGGEDYELLFTARKRVPAKIAGVAITPVGEITRERRIVLVHGGSETELTPRGWEHFGPTS